MDPHPDDPKRTGPMYTSRRRRTREGRRALPLVGYALLLAVAGILGWMWQSSRETPLGDMTGPSDAEAATPDTADGALERMPAVPALDSSDSFVRTLASRVSAHPQFATWLVTDDLARRFVLTVVQVAHGRSPESQLGFMAPAERFTPRTEEGRFLLDAQSYGRYDVLAEAFTSHDPEGTAEAFERLHPLFERAYRELGLPDQTFDETLQVAFERMLEAEVPEGPIEVRPDGAVYGFTDEDLEQMSPAQKVLVRMGPENARQVQEKLRELAGALGMEPVAAGREDPAARSGG